MKNALILIVNAQIANVIHLIVNKLMIINITK